MLTKYDLATRLEPQYRVRDEFGRLFNRGKKQLWLWRVTFSFFQHHPSACLLKLPSCSSWDDISSAATICHHLLWQMKRQWKTKNKMTNWMVEILIKHLTFLLRANFQTFLWTCFCCVEQNHPNYNDELESNLDYNYYSTFLCMTILKRSWYMV